MTASSVRLAILQERIHRLGQQYMAADANTRQMLISSLWDIGTGSQARNIPVMLARVRRIQLRLNATRRRSSGNDYLLGSSQVSISSVPISMFPRYHSVDHIQPSELLRLMANGFGSVGDLGSPVNDCLVALKSIEAGMTSFIEELTKDVLSSLTPPKIKVCFTNRSPSPKNDSEVSLFCVDIRSAKRRRTLNAKRDSCATASVVCQSQICIDPVEQPGLRSNVHPDSGNHNTVKDQDDTNDYGLMLVQITDRTSVTNSELQSIGARVAEYVSTKMFAFDATAKFGPYSASVLELVGRQATEEVIKNMTYKNFKLPDLRRCSKLTLNESKICIEQWSAALKTHDKSAEEQFDTIVAKKLDLTNQNRPWPLSTFPERRFTG